MLPGWLGGTGRVPTRYPHGSHTGAGARPVRGLAVRLGRHALLMLRL